MCSGAFQIQTVAVLYVLVIFLSAREGKVALGTCEVSWERAVLKLSTVNQTCDKHPTWNISFALRDCGPICILILLHS